MKRTALITGISGQDGSYLAELLLAKGYVVHGYSRDTLGDLGCSQHLQNDLTIHRFAANNQHKWERLLAVVRPDELYHLAANSFVPASWQDPVANNDANYGLTARILEALRKVSPTTRLLNACSSEVFGHRDNDGTGLNEDSPICPVSPYGISKAASKWLVASYRREYDMHVSNAILFNHESPRRDPNFVTRKITLAVARIKHGFEDHVSLGDLDAVRDWGYAGDYVDGMWRMLQLDQAEDFVLGTGKLVSIREFAAQAFSTAGLDWQDYVRIDPGLVRVRDNKRVFADCGKAESMLEWTAATPISRLINMMVESDLDLVSQMSHNRRAA